MSQVRLNNKANNISLTISSNLLYFNFTKSQQKTLKQWMLAIYVETMLILH